MKIEHFEEKDGIVSIPFRNGHLATIDASDLPLVKARRWYARTVFSGTTYIASSEGTRTVSLHRFLMQPPAGYEIDHKDGNGLNNTRANLRLCSRSQNLRNKRPKNTGGFKGVHFRRGKWEARLQPRNGVIYLGKYETDYEAAKAYDLAAVKHYGEFARLNFPQSPLMGSA